MKITLAAIADYASVSAGEKLNVMGVFDTIFARNFPAVHPMLYIAVRLQFGNEDRLKSFDVRMHLEDEDGHRSLENTAHGKIGDVPPGEAGSANIVMGVPGLSLRGPGRYSFVVMLEKEEVRLPLRVVRHEQ